MHRACNCAACVRVHRGRVDRGAHSRRRCECAPLLPSRRYKGECAAPRRRAGGERARARGQADPKRYRAHFGVRQQSTAPHPFLCPKPISNAHARARASRENKFNGAFDFCVAIVHHSCPWLPVTFGAHCGGAFLACGGKLQACAAYMSGALHWLCWRCAYLINVQRAWQRRWHVP